MTIAYDRTQKAAKRAFSGWHISKQSEAVATCIAKMWDQWLRLLLRGRSPEPMIAGLLKYSRAVLALDERVAHADGIGLWVEFLPEDLQRGVAVEFTEVVFAVLPRNLLRKRQLRLLILVEEDLPRRAVGLR